jgi:hypothetical protein
MIEHHTALDATFADKGDIVSIACNYRIEVGEIITANDRVFLENEVSNLLTALGMNVKKSPESETVAREEGQ